MTSAPSASPGYSPSGRWIVIGVGTARAPWFGELAAMATSGALPVELVRCVSVGDALDRIAARTASALLIDELAPGLDRDAIDHAARTGCLTFIVGTGRTDWAELGAAGLLHPGFTASELLGALERAARPVARAALTTIAAPTGPAGAGAGRLVTVTGPGGTGASTVAALLAQGLAGPARVLLADACLYADQAALHGTADVVPGLPELVDAHRSGAPTPVAVRRMVFDVETRGYHLLLGLRRHRDWVGIRPRALDGAVRTMTDLYDLVIADIDADLEGEDETGSIEVEERNVLARRLLPAADVVVVVGGPGLKGVHALARTIRLLVDHGIDVGRLVPVINDAPRSPIARREQQDAVRELTRSATGRAGDLAEPLLLPHRRGVDGAWRDATRFPTDLCRVLSSAVIGALAELTAPSEVVPLPIRPGSLGLAAERSA